MKSVICKVLSVIIAGGGIVVSIIEKNPIFLFCFLLGGFIAYELAIIMENNK